MSGINIDWLWTQETIHRFLANHSPPNWVWGGGDRSEPGAHPGGHQWDWWAGTGDIQCSLHQLVLTCKYHWHLVMGWFYIVILFYSVLYNATSICTFYTCQICKKNALEKWGNEWHRTAWVFTYPYLPYPQKWLINEKLVLLKQSVTFESPTFLRDSSFFLKSSIKIMFLIFMNMNNVIYSFPHFFYQYLKYIYCLFVT